MIQGPAIKEKNTIIRANVNYRALPSLNCSMIKLFDSDPVKFFEQFKLGRTRKEKKSTSLSIGDLVDFFLLDCKGDEDEFNNRFDEKFALLEGVKGSGQVFILADTLFDVTKEYINADGEVTIDFDTRFKEAYVKVQAEGKYSKKSEEKVLEDFMENGLSYYQTLVDNIGKTVVDVSLLDKSRKIADLLIEDPFTKDVFQEDDMEYFPKFPIEWTYTTKAGKKIPCKSELDILRIDHANQIIYPKDLKTTYDNEGFEIGYLKYSYYLQAAFYQLAVQDWAKQEGMENYHIEPMEFVVGDTSANNRRPIRYQLSQEDMEKAMNGFTLSGQPYRGIHELIEEISWNEDNNSWNVSKKVVDNNGILKLNLKYE